MAKIRCFSCGKDYNHPTKSWPSNDTCPECIEKSNRSALIVLSMIMFPIVAPVVLVIIVQILMWCGVDI